MATPHTPINSSAKPGHTSPHPEPVLVEFSSHVLSQKGGSSIVEEAREACRAAGFRFGIQIHNASPKNLIEQIAGLDIPVSVHAPLLAEHLMNLASEDIAPAMASMEGTIAHMRSLDCGVAVFHGFVMTDTPIRSFNASLSYNECMRKVNRPELGLEGSAICSNFLVTEEYETRYNRVCRRLARIRKRYPGLTLAIENDFPLYGSGFLLSDRAEGLHNPLCLDTGHLWAASFVFDRTFLQEVERFLATGMVELVHLHASTCKHGLPKTQWHDGHQPLGTPNEMQLESVVALARKAGVRHFTLEIPHATKEDIRRFAEMWEKPDSG